MKRNWKSLAALLLFLMTLVTGCSEADVTNALSVAQDVVSQTVSEGVEEYDALDTDETWDDIDITEDEAQTDAQQSAEQSEQNTAAVLSESGTYTTKDEVAAYLHTYGHLPDNFITKKEAQELGWVSKEGNLGQVAPGKSIGGDRFGNYEGLLPDVSGRKYFECDVNSTGGYRGAERIIFSNDGLIYYTADHYKTFTLLYGEE